MAVIAIPTAAQIQRCFPPGATRDTVQQLPPDPIARIASAVWDEIQQVGAQGSMHFDEWQEMYTYVRRAEARLVALQRIAQAQ